MKCGHYIGLHWPGGTDPTIVSRYSVNSLKAAVIKIYN